MEIFTKILPVGVALFQADRHDEANRRYSIFLFSLFFFVKAPKWINLNIGCIHMSSLWS